MGYTNEEILRRIGLFHDGRNGLRDGSPIILSGSATDSRSGLLISLTSTASFDDNGLLSDISLEYWRHLPYGESRNQNLIRIKMKPVEGGKVEPDQIWVQSKPVHEKTDFSIKDTNRVFGAIGRLNELLREKGPVEDFAKVMEEARISDVTGESLVVRGMDKVKGGISFSLAPVFMKAASQGSATSFSFNKVDASKLKTALGFHINSLEVDKNYTGSREVYSVDPQSGVEFKAEVQLKESARKLTLEMAVSPTAAPDDTEPKSMPELVKLEFRKRQGDKYELEKAVCLGQPIKLNDTARLLHVLGFAQACNKDFSNWKFPSFMDHAAEFDLLDMLSPFPAPPSLEKDGGEFLYGSLHGSGFEKKIENFGDQIGAASLFLHRGIRADGEISTVGVAVDFPFASGGPNSGYDGAIPDYLPYWDDLRIIAITHDHFDHVDGVPYYARKGLLKDKTIVCEKRVKYFIKHKMDNLNVPAELRPKIVSLEGEGAIPVFDDKDEVRMWVQYNPNATEHSALCTPYIVTGCYGDKHYNGSVLVYGDGRGFKEEALPFFAEGTRRLPKLAAEKGFSVTAKKVDRDITVAMHDVTGSRYDGESPTAEEVERNQSVLLDWFSDMGIIMAPISTNNAEYSVGLDLAHRTGRNITGVGSNAELRLSCMNLFGPKADLDLSQIRIDPFEEQKKAPENRVIPQDILDRYFSVLEDVAKEMASDLSDFDLESEDRRAKYLAKAHENFSKEFKKNDEEISKSVSKTNYYMMSSLLKNGAVVFENNINGYLMWRAVTDKKETASLRATRGSQTGKSFREDPSKQIIFVTGTQGNSEERFSTLQKFKDYISLLDVDETVRPTGYKINAEDYVAVITQPSIPGNEAAQDKMIGELVRARDITVVAAFQNGFKIYNPKDHKDKIIRDLNLRGWKYQGDADGGIRVLSRPIHIHGHGFYEDIKKMARAVRAESHECHHVPGPDAYDSFRNLVREEKLTHSGTTPDDFQFFRTDAKAKESEGKFNVVAKVNPSYILVRMIRKFGQFFGGYLEWTRATMMRREGRNREDGLMVRTNKDGTYERLTAQVDWEKVCNPQKRAHSSERFRRLGPSIVDKDPDRPRRPRSRPIWSNDVPEVA